MSLPLQFKTQAISAKLEVNNEEVLISAAFALTSANFCETDFPTH
jgi:hypothetical protein